MENIYRDIAKRTNGEVFIGVVGPVRTGKSTFIKKVMDTLVIPNIKDSLQRERTVDELPQSAAGKTIMTTEPKFIPEQAIEVELEDNTNLRLRLIDCVGYIVDSAIGHIENEQPRMVISPWYDGEVPFNIAAETGTKKVITEHSTIGIVITTDGSITNIGRSEYEGPERRVVNELKMLNKPFVMLLNCLNPRSEQSIGLAMMLQSEYDVPVLPINCLELDEVMLKRILTLVTSEFPVHQINFNLPGWVNFLPREHKVKSDIYGTIRYFCSNVSKMRDVGVLIPEFEECESVETAQKISADLGNGTIEIEVSLPNGLFYKTIGEMTGIDVSDEASLFCSFAELAAMKESYSKVIAAVEQAKATGYGIVMPTIDELRLEEPEIMNQGGKYGVRLKASAPSIHMLSADITTEINPIVGSEKQSEELVMYLLGEFEENPLKIWQSNIFGKSLNELVNEGLQNKLTRLPAEARGKLQQTLEGIINEGCNGLVCIIL